MTKFAAEQEALATTSPATEAEGGGDGGRRSRWWILVALVAGVAAVLVIVLVVSGDERETPDGDDAAPGVLPRVSASIDAEGQELLDLLAAGRGLTFHGRYEATGDSAGIGTELSVDLWRRDGLVRQDTRQVTKAGTVETAAFLLGDDGMISCSRVDEAEWTCAIQRAAANQSAADALFGAVAMQLQGADVTVTDEEVVGQPARCFAISATDGGVSLCVSTDGVPLRLQGESAELLLAERSGDVPDATFTPPAEPVSAEAEG